MLLLICPISSLPGAEPEISQGMELSWNQSTLINILSKTQEFKVRQEKILEFFFLDTLKTTFWMKTLTQGWTQSGSFFYPNQETFFNFQKTPREVSPPSLCSCAAAFMTDLRKMYFHFVGQENVRVFFCLCQFFVYFISNLCEKVTEMIENNIEIERSSFCITKVLGWYLSIFIRHDKYKVGK